jgi:hypothetical protein
MQGDCACYIVVSGMGCALALAVLSADYQGLQQGGSFSVCVFSEMVPTPTLNKVPCCHKWSGFAVVALPAWCPS